MCRVFEIDVLQCPRCKASPMRVLAVIHPPMTTQVILKSLGLPTRAPPITPARPVPEDWSLAESSSDIGASARVARPPDGGSRGRWAPVRARSGGAVEISVV